MAEKIRISMVRCCLIDRLYIGVLFSDIAFHPYLSKGERDGGLVRFITNSIAEIHDPEVSILLARI